MFLINVLLAPFLVTTILINTSLNVCGTAASHKYYKLTLTFWIVTIDKDISHPFCFKMVQNLLSISAVIIIIYYNCLTSRYIYICTFFGIDKVLNSSVPLAEASKWRHCNVAEQTSMQILDWRFRPLHCHS